MAAPLTPRQQSIVDLLAQGPRTMRELVEACGYEPSDRAGHSYVSLTLRRLSRRGYSFHNFKPPGSHRGAYYVLMARPHPGRRLTTGPARCARCGALLASDHAGDTYCSPCQRLAVTEELDYLAPPSLFDDFDEEVAS